MNPFRLFLRLSIIQRSIYLTTTHHLSHNSISRTTTTHFEPQSKAQPSTQTPSPESDYIPGKFIANRLSISATLLELNHTFAQIIRTHTLHFHPVPFTWNNIIRSYVRLDFPFMAIRVYVAMSRAGISPDSYTIPIVLKAVCQCFTFEIAWQLHTIAIRVGLESNEFCESAFISFYAKTGEFGNARKVFDENPERKLGSWNAIIGGLAQGAHAKDAIVMFLELRKLGFTPDDVTMVSVTSACGGLGDLSLGLQLHKYVFQAKSLGKSYTLMSNSLIDMYAKCGRMDLADRVFLGTRERDVSTWTSIIVGHAMHGRSSNALECFRCMREARVMPNHVTFVGVLSACVHGGIVEEGKRYFDAMKNTYGIVPMMQHYGCMADLFGKAGLFEEAKEMVKRMPMRANSIVWGCLMGACEKHENVEMGEWVAQNMMELEACDDGVYVALSNIYASKGMWEEVERVRRMMKERRLAKIPGFSLSASAA